MLMSQTIICITMMFLILSLCLILGKSKKEDKIYQVQKFDLPYIACDVCDKSLTEFYNLLSVLRLNSPYKKVDEIVIVENLDQICNPSNSTWGKWLRQLDIVEDKLNKGGSVLRLIQPGGIAKCEEECVTIAKSCELLFEEEISDRDELSSIFWKNKLSIDQIKTKFCEKETGRCKSNKPKYLPSKHNRIDYLFNEMSEKDIQMEELMAQMKSSGLGDGMSMYGRDDLDSMMAGGLGDYGYGGDDEDIYSDSYNDNSKGNYEF